MKFQLCLYCIAIRWESITFYKNFMSFFCGIIERNHQKMEVCSEGIHDHNFNGFCAHDFGHTFGEKFVVGHPWIFGFKMAFDTQIGPIIQLLLNGRFGGLGLKSQRIPCKIQPVVALLIFWDVECSSVLSEWIVPV